MTTLTVLTVLLAFAAIAIAALKLQRHNTAQRSTEDEHATRNTGDTFVSDTDSLYVLAQINSESRKSRPCTFKAPPYGLI